MKRIFLYVSGCLAFSIGAKLFIDSHLGVDPLDALVIGISKHTGLLLGTISGGLCILFLLVWSAWNKKWPPLTTLVTMFGVGYLIDFWNWMNFRHGLDPRICLIAGLFFVAYGSALIIMSGYGIRVMDLMALSFVEKMGWPFIGAKLMFEVSFITSGWLLGGPVGVGTVAFLLLVGTLIVPVIYIKERYLGFPNYSILSALPLSERADRS